MCPTPHFETLRREAYLVTYDLDGAQVFTKVPFSSLQEDDLFTLEAPTAGAYFDPLAGEVAVERMYRAISDPYMSEPETGDWLIDCERI